MDNNSLPPAKKLKSESEDDTSGSDDSSDSSSSYSRHQEECRKLDSEKSCVRTPKKSQIGSVSENAYMFLFNSSPSTSQDTHAVSSNEDLSIHKEPEVDLSKTKKPEIHFSIPKKPEIYLPPKKSEIYLPQKKPELYLPPDKPELYLPPKKPELYLPPKKPEAYLPQSKPEIYLPPKKPEFYLPPEKPEFYLPPKKPETYLPQKRPEIYLPPKKPEFYLPPKKPETYLPQKRPEIYLPPKKPEFYLPPKKPETYLPQKKPEIYLRPQEPGIYMPPKKPEMYLPPRKPEMYLPPKKPEIYLPPKEPEIYLPPQEPEIYLPPKKPEIYLPIPKEPQKCIRVVAESNQVDLLKESGPDPKAILGPRMFPPEIPESEGARNLMAELKAYRRKRRGYPRNNTNSQIVYGAVCPGSNPLHETPHNQPTNQIPVNSFNNTEIINQGSLPYPVKKEVQDTETADKRNLPSSVKNEFEDTETCTQRHLPCPVKIEVNDTETTNQKFPLSEVNGINQIDLLGKLNPVVYLGPRICLPENCNFINVQDFMPTNKKRMKKLRRPSKRTNAHRKKQRRPRKKDHLTELKRVLPKRTNTRAGISNFNNATTINLPRQTNYRTRLSSLYNPEINNQNSLCHSEEKQITDIDLLNTLNLNPVVQQNSLCHSEEKQINDTDLLNKSNLNPVVQQNSLDYSEETQINDIDLFNKSNLNPVAQQNSLGHSEEKQINDIDLLNKSNLNPVAQQNSLGHSEEKQLNDIDLLNKSNLNPVVQQNSLCHSEVNQINDINFLSKLNLNPVVQLTKIDVTENFKISNFVSKTANERSEEIEIIGEYETTQINNRKGKGKIPPKWDDIFKTLQSIAPRKGKACTKRREKPRGPKSKTKRRRRKPKRQYKSRSQNEPFVLLCHGKKPGSFRRILTVTSIFRKDVPLTTRVQLHSNSESEVIAMNENDKLGSENQHSVSISEAGEISSQASTLCETNENSFSSADCNIITPSLDTVLSKNGIQGKDAMNQMLVCPQKTVCIFENKSCEENPSSVCMKSSALSRLVKRKVDNCEKRKKRKSLFVAKQDGTIVEVDKKDRLQVLMQAAAKISVINKCVWKMREMDQAQYGNSKKLLPPKLPYSIRRCYYDKHTPENVTVTVTDKGTKLLHDYVQLVESKLPLHEAKNYIKLCGEFLFRQTYRSVDSTLQCILCKNYSKYSPKDLQKHYETIHNFHVLIGRAEFSEYDVFLVVPLNMKAEDILNNQCCFCNSTLKTLKAACEHYRNAHGKPVRLICDSVASNIEKFIYCGLCNQPSADFLSHRQHMANIHKLSTFGCRFCSYCTSQSNLLLSHVRENHMTEEVGPKVNCPMCSVVLLGRDRLKKHITLTHGVQTGPVTWSCSKCLFPFKDVDAFVNHVPRCSVEETLEAATAAKNPPFRVGRPFAEHLPRSYYRGIPGNECYNCIECPSIFSSEEGLKKHVSDAHGQGTSEVGASNLEQQKKYNLLNRDKNTCFICSVSFSSAEMCRKHQFHSHMAWVNRGSMDYSDFSEVNSVKIKQEILSPDETSSNLNDYASNLNTYEQIKIKDEPIIINGFTCSKDATKRKEESFNQVSVNVDKEKNPAESEVSKMYKLLGDFNVSFDELPNDRELEELVFPNKFVHFCHICAALITNYRLYYLHMHNYHQMDKMFQCVITNCKKTFSQSSSFQKHALKHNQMSDHCCAVCDDVFEDDEELRDHLFSPEHMNKYKKIQVKFTRPNPKNHRCKICFTWFGMASTFTKHMEFDSHKYPCRVCNLLFVQPIPRRNHIDSAHPEVSKVCEFCGSEFTDSNSLWKHLVTHNVVYECSKCFRRFIHKEQHDLHFEVHQPPIPCPVKCCPRKLQTKLLLFYHVKTHQSSTVHVCSVCSKGFVMKEYLKKHMKTSHNLSHSITPPPTQALSSEESVSERYKNKQINTSQNVQSVTSVQTVSSEDSREGTVACTTLLDPNQQLEALKQLAEQSIDSFHPEMIQLACAGCMCTFETKNHFLNHVCTGEATSDAMGQLVLIPPNEISDVQLFFQTEENRNEFPVSLLHENSADSSKTDGNRNEFSVSLLHGNSTDSSKSEGNNNEFSVSLPHENSADSSKTEGNKNEFLVSLLHEMSANSCKTEENKNEFSVSLLYENSAHSSKTEENKNEFSVAHLHKTSANSSSNLPSESVPNTWVIPHVEIKTENVLEDDASLSTEAS